jgi:hypothetical protein
MKPIMGIHSNVTSGEKTGGHAWISITENGASKTYGLWPDSHPRTVDNGPGHDVRVGMEDNLKSAASRFYALSGEQLQQLKVLVARSDTWNYTHNCSSWASYVVRRVLRVDINADDAALLGVETPRELGTSIRMLEVKDPTNRMQPKDLGGQPQTSTASSSFL